jgi:hypothetical protein
MRMLSLRRPTTKMAPNATMTPNMTRPRNALNAGSVQSRVTGGGWAAAHSMSFAWNTSSTGRLK